MRILVTGADGMLGSSLCRELKRQGYIVFKTDVHEKDNIRKLDICDFDEARILVEEVKPEIIFHLAAATDLDWCEQNSQDAYRVNVTGTENITKICRQCNILMVYLSTSGVFDGEKSEPYMESDKPNPINVYGKTKLEGEIIVQNLLDKYFILRASWMVGGGKKDKKFVGKIINLIQNGIKEIKAVNDKFGSPTFTDDFARNVMSVIMTERYSIYHMANKGWCSRFELAKKIVEGMNKDTEVVVQSVSSGTFPLVAFRPRSEMIINHQLDILGLNNMPHWEEGLKNYIKLCLK